MRPGLLFACVFTALVLPDCVFAGVVRVRQDGSGDFLTLAPAVAAAAPNDSISVGPGVYTEPATLAIAKALTFFSTSGPAVTILDGQNARRIMACTVAGLRLQGLSLINGLGEGGTTAAGALFLVTGTRTTLENCVFRNHHAEVGGAIYVTDQTQFNNTRLDAHACVFEDNVGTGTAGAVYVVNGAVGTFNDCIFRRNTTALKAGAVHVIRSRADFESCFFRGNRSADIAGAIFYESSAGTTRSCTFYDHTSPGQIAGTIVIQLSTGTLITQNIFSGDTAGFGLRYFQGVDTHSCNVYWNNSDGAVGADALAANEVVANPLFCDPPGDDFTIAVDSPAAAAHNACGVLAGKYPAICATVPVEITDLTAEATGRGVVLSWSVSGDALRELQSVGVERADAPAGLFSALTAGGLVPARSMTFADDGASSGRTYWYRLALMTTGGEQHYAGPVRIETGDPARLGTALEPPVVAADAVRIRYRLGHTGDGVQLDVFDVGGRRIRQLERGTREAGQYLRNWDRRDDSGASVSSGVYLIHLSAGGGHYSQKAVLVRE